MKLYQTQMKYRRVKNNSVGNGKKAKEGRWVANEKKKRLEGWRVQHSTQNGAALNSGHLLRQMSAIRIKYLF